MRMMRLQIRHWSWQWSRRKRGRYIVWYILISLGLTRCALWFIKTPWVCFKTLAILGQKPQGEATKELTTLHVHLIYAYMSYYASIYLIFIIVLVLHDLARLAGNCSIQGKLLNRQLSKNLCIKRRPRKNPSATLFQLFILSFIIPILVVVFGLDDSE